MRVVIIEDEKLAADYLEKTLLSIEKDIEVIAKIPSVRESVIWLQENEADLIFLDINLSDGMCFKIFDQVTVKTPIIFTTAYDQYAIKAFKLNSIDYLLKPIDKQELTLSLSKFKELYKAAEKSSVNFTDLINALNSTKQNYQDRFVIYAGQKIKVVKTTDIAYFYSIDGDTFLCSNSKENYSLEYSLDKLETMLDPAQYFRINRQFFVNLDAIKNMYIHTKSRIKLELNPPYSEEIVVSLNRCSDFRKWLGK